MTGLLISDAVTDSRILSNNPHDWDKIKNLDNSHEGYWTLPDFYRQLRIQKTNSKQIFFNTGIFIISNPADMPADVFLRYMKSKNYNPATEWKNLWQEFLRYDLEITNRDDLNTIHINSYSVEDFYNSASNLLLRDIQKNFIPKTDKDVSKDTLYTSYKKITCNNRNMKNYMPFEKLSENEIFINMVNFWKHKSRIEHLLNIK